MSAAAHHHQQPPPPLADLYGLAVPAEHCKLLETYTAIWLELDDMQTCHWRRFLATAAAQLGLLQPADEDEDGSGSGSPAQQQQLLNLYDPACHALVEATLQQLLARGERHAPELWADLAAHVAGGVPSCLRQLAWPCFARAGLVGSAAPAGAPPPPHAAAAAAAEAGAAGAVQQQLETEEEAQQQHKGGLRPWLTPHSYSRLVELQQQLFAAVAAAHAAAATSSSSQPPATKPPLPPGPVTAAAPAVPPQQPQQPLEADVAAAEAELAGLLGGAALSRAELALWRGSCRTWASQIDKDVHRTYPGHAWLSSPPGQACLTRLLSTFCLVAPHLGYCQGMNYVAGGMLLLLGAGLTTAPRARGASSRGGSQQQHAASGGGSSGAAADSPAPAHGGDGDSSGGSSSSSSLPLTQQQQNQSTALAAIEATVFGCLLSFADTVLPGYWSPAMVAPQVDQRVVAHLASEHLGPLTDRLGRMGLNPAQPTPAWLLAGFAASGMPLESVGRLWDVALFERSGAVLVRACLALLHLFSAAFEAATDCCDAGLLLQALPGMAFDGERLLALTREVYGEIDGGVLLALQHCFRAEVLAEREQASAAARKFAAPPSPRQEQEPQQQQQQPRAGATSGAGSTSSSSSTPAAAPSNGDSSEQAPDWVPDFDAAAPAPKTAPCGGSGGTAAAPAGSAPVTRGSAGGAAAAAPAAAALKAPAAAAAPAPACPKAAAAAAAAADEGEADDEDLDRETGSLLPAAAAGAAAAGPRGTRQHQQPPRAGRGGSGGRPAGTAADGGRPAGLASIRTSSGNASGSSGGAATRGHSLQVSQSRAIAQALAIACVPGLPLPPSPTARSAAQHPPALLPHQHPTASSTSSSTNGSSSGGRGSGRGGGFLRSLGVQRSSSTTTSTSRSGGGGVRHAGSAGPVRNQASAPPTSSSSSATAAADGFCCGSPGELTDSSYMTAHNCYVNVTGDEDGDGDSSGGGWMLLGGSSPRAAAAAGAGTAAVDDGATANGGGAASSNGSMQQQRRQEAAGSSEQLVQASLQDSFWLAELQQQLQALTADAAGAAGVGGGGERTNQQQHAHDGDVRVDGTAAPAEPHPGSSTQQPFPSAPPAGSALALASAAVSQLAAAVRQLSQQAAGVTALQCQLDRSMQRLEQQDAELASKDEAIEGLQQQLRQLQQAWQAHHAQHPSNGSADGGSPAGHGPRGNHQHHHQQQQIHAARGGTHVPVHSSSINGSGGQGFVAAALARFNSPTKTRVPAQQQQQQQQSRAGRCPHHGGLSAVGS